MAAKFFLLARDRKGVLLVGTCLSPQRLEVLSPQTFEVFFPLIDNKSDALRPFPIVLGIFSYLLFRGVLRTFAAALV